MEVTTSSEQVKSRVPVIDIIRGVSIAGISLANASLMNTSVEKTMEGRFYYQSGLLESVTSFILDNFIYQKFTGIFVFLFGLSLHLFHQSLQKKGLETDSILRKRFFGIFILGFLQTLFIWWGDILMIYGIFGLALIPLMRRPAEDLLKVCGIILVCAALGQILALFPYFDEAPALKKVLAQNPMYLTLGFWAIVPYRVLDYYNSNFVGFLDFKNMHMFSAYLNFMLRLFFFMVLGLYCGKKSYFSDLKKHNLFFFKVGSSCAVMMGFFLACKLLVLEEGSTTLNIWMEFTLPLVYTSLFVFLSQTSYGRWMLLPFAKIGKMTLSNYLMINLTLSLVLYGYGLSYYGQISMFAISMLTVFIYATYSAISYVYLNFFSFGPAEWVLRKWTYWNWSKGSRQSQSSDLRVAQ